jgi:hypothetical protein
MSRKPKQISVLSEIGEGNVSEKWVEDAPVFGLGFSRNRQKGNAVQNLAGALHNEAVKFKLSVGREVKTEIPNKAKVLPPLELTRCDAWMKPTR